MANPKGLKRFPPGIRLSPEAIDALPVDWPTVDYTVKIRAHPDIPSLAILRYVATGFAPESEPLLGETEPSAGFGSIRDDDGELIYALPE